MKKIIKENVRVEVTPKYYLRVSLKNNIRDCEDMVSQIKKHVDGVGFCEVVWDSIETCEFCGTEWEVNEDPNDPDVGLGEPLCCTKAQREWEEQHD